MADGKEPDLLEVLDEHFLISMQDKRTSFPAKIVSANIQTGKCTIQPIHKFKIVETGQIVKPALIEDVPIVFPRSAGSIDVFPLKKGDIGQAIVSDRSISEWLSGGGTEIYPENRNIMEGSQASFIPGGYPFRLSFGSNLPENTRSIIVKPGTKLYLGNPKYTLPLNGGTLDIVNLLNALVAIVTQIDGAMTVPLVNATKLAELTSAISTIKATP